MGCVLAHVDERAVFVDPLLPGDETAFWARYDEAVGDRPVHVLTTIRFHGRSREAIAERYGGEVVTSLRRLPSSVEALRFRAADETMFWLPAHGALVPGDRIIGDEPEGVRLCPDSWLTYLTPPLTQRDLRALLRPLLDLPVERILVSHGAPVLSGGAAALRALLSDARHV